MGKYINQTKSVLAGSIIFLCAIMIFTGCSDKKYGYTYFEEGEAVNAVKQIPFTPNDFKINFRLALDSVILDKDKPARVLVEVKISGQHQYWPRDLKMEVYCNDEKMSLTDSVKKYSISSVINDRVSYFTSNSSDFNIPELIGRLKQEHGIPDSINYYSVTCGLNSEYLKNDSNPERMTIKVKALWKDGSETMEKTFILTKVDITKHHARPRWYG
jgi:hypothetical protein